MHCSVREHCIDGDPSCRVDGSAQNNCDNDDIYNNEIIMKIITIIITFIIYLAK